MDLFTLVKALGADDFVSPTIPFVPPNGGITPVPTVVTGGPSISLESNVISIKKGEKAKIKVVIFTEAKEIKGFTLKISYNPELFKIIDANANVSGVQVSYGNTYFLESENIVKTEEGAIYLKASSDTGTSAITNRVVAEFEAEALTKGIGNFQVIQNQSSLINSRNENILKTVNGVNVTVGDITVYTSVTPSITRTAVPGQTGTTGPTTGTPKPTTPKTALSDDLNYGGSVLIGIFLITAGIYLFRKKRSYDLHG